MSTSVSEKYRNAIITGASSGLGRELSLWFAKQGVRVFAAARRADKLKSLEEEGRAIGGTIEAVALDVNDARGTIKRLTELDEQSGGLDLVIANAGIGRDTNGKRLDWNAVEEIIQTNVTGASATLCAVLPKMVERQRGHLVGVSSLAAYRGLPNNGAYSASKAFVTVFLEGLRVDLKPIGIQVTSINPGFVKSELTAKNKYRMPFLLETADAAERIGQAIVRGDAEFGFPAPMVALTKLMKAMPNSLWDRAARRLR